MEIWIGWISSKSRYRYNTISCTVRILFLWQQSAAFKAHTTCEAKVSPPHIKVETFDDKYTLCDTICFWRKAIRPTGGAVNSPSRMRTIQILGVEIGNMVQSGIIQLQIHHHFYKMWNRVGNNQQRFAYDWGSCTSSSHYLLRVVVFSHYSNRSCYQTPWPDIELRCYGGGVQCD